MLDWFAMAKARSAPAPGAASTDDDVARAAGRLAIAAVERLVARRDAADGSDVVGRAETALADARAAFSAALASQGPFSALAFHARLDIAEAETLAVAIGVERDHRLQQLLVHLHGDADRARLELGTLDELFGDAHPGALTAGPDSGLVRAALIEVLPGRTWSQQRVAVAASVIWALAGDPTPDPHLPVAFERHGATPAVDGASGSVLVTGRDRVRRREAGARRGAARRYIVGPAPDDDAGWAAVVREATLLGAGVMVELDHGITPVGRRWIDRARHLCWVLLARHSLDLDALPRRDWVEVTAADDPPTDDEWRALLGDAERRHALSREQLDLVARTLPLTAGDLDAAVRRLVSSRLEELARRIRPTRNWSDLILPPGQQRQLRELVERYRQADTVYGDWAFPAVPSRGLVALFSGPSGTGKTLAAEVIAGELGLDVFKLDLSSVVSKYIGETEKNLEEMFDAADAGNLVLFFDEADALFGKRSEVKDAHDKYANLETSYLLQRLETYDGVVVLATNFEKNIDEAFLRRIHTRVDFATPTEAERVAIWKRHIEHRAPVDGLDYVELASRFELTGGSIRNAAVNAAFLAAAEDGPITMERVVRCLAREYRKLGRLLKKDDFGPYYEHVTAELARG